MAWLTPNFYYCNSRRGMSLIGEEWFGWLTVWLTCNNILSPPLLPVILSSSHLSLLPGLSAFPSSPIIRISLMTTSRQDLLSIWLLHRGHLPFFYIIIFFLLIQRQHHIYTVWRWWKSTLQCILWWRYEDSCSACSGHLFLWCLLVNSCTRTGYFPASTAACSLLTGTTSKGNNYRATPKSLWDTNSQRKWYE